MEKKAKLTIYILIIAILTVLLAKLVIPGDSFEDVQDFASGIGNKVTGNDITSAFVDPNFLNEVRIVTGKSDGPIYKSDVENITELNIPHLNIANLLGIEYFKSLTWLICYGNQLTTLDISKNTELKRLICSDNQLTVLNVSNNAQLVRLECSGNQMTTLEVSKNGALELLDCTFNNLTTLDISDCTALNQLVCYNNQLTTLNASGCTKLDFIDCSRNQLSSINVSGCTSLMELTCYNNKLTKLDVSECSALRQLNCMHNNMISYDDVIGWQYIEKDILSSFRFNPQNEGNTSMPLIEAPAAEIDNSSSLGQDAQSSIPEYVQDTDMLTVSLTDIYAGDLNPVIDRNYDSVYAKIERGEYRQLFGYDLGEKVDTSLHEIEPVFEWAYYTAYKVDSSLVPAEFAVNDKGEFDWVAFNIGNFFGMELGKDDLNKLISLIGVPDYVDYDRGSGDSAAGSGEYYVSYNIGITNMGVYLNEDGVVTGIFIEKR